MAHLATPTSTPRSTPLRRPLSADDPRRSPALMVLVFLWLAIFFASLFAPPLLDDADASHASAARHIALSGDWVTLQIDGIRYLEKAPLPYWLVALSYRLFGFNTFATHLPQSIAVLLLALLGYHWAARAFNLRTAFYTGLGVLTSAGVFLFTRVFIPEVLLSLLLCTALYLFLRSLELSPLTNAVISTEASPRNAVISTEALPPNTVISTEAQRSGEIPSSTKPHKPGSASRQTTPAWRPFAMWAVLALAVLTKGLVALVFFFGATLLYLILTNDFHRWRALKPVSGILLLLAIATPWHILAGLRNTGGLNGHGFFWFYFINEHVLRFLGRRYPRDYNKLPGYLFWSLHLVWLFPWSLFVPTGVLLALRRLRSPHGPILPRLRSLSTTRGRTALLLTIYTLLILVFFSLSTNQEYYTFPAYLPLLMLIAAAITRAEQTFSADRAARHWITVAHATLTLIGVVSAIALLIGLWQSRHLPFIPDIGDLLAHRAVGDYTLSMSHFFYLTGPSFAALRLPSVLAALAFALGPAFAWLSRQQRRHVAATVAVALFSAVFLLAAHIALIRFGALLSSKNFADTIQHLEATDAVSSTSQILLFGDQSFGSSIPFYLGRQVSLVDGRSSSMIFGSTFPDAPPIFLSPADLTRQWGTGPRKLLFVPLERRDAFDQLNLTHRAILLQETSGKALYTDRPLNR
jgi:4-amino-4-deoxy-L-arabinose transferase-like glycosyltransferase